MVTWLDYYTASVCTECFRSNAYIFTTYFRGGNKENRERAVQGKGQVGLELRLWNVRAGIVLLITGGSFFLRNIHPRARCLSGCRVNRFSAVSGLITGTNRASSVRTRNLRVCVNGPGSSPRGVTSSISLLSTKTPGCPYLVNSCDLRRWQLDRG